MKKSIFILTIIFLLLASMTAYGTIFYLDYENGDDANDGSDWANAWKTITLGATAARTAPGDIIRIAKSPAPASIGDGTWTNLSKTVTLATAGTAVIDLCETAWTAGEASVTRDSSYEKEGTYDMKVDPSASPTVSTMQAYYEISDTDFSSYQKISFWLRNAQVLLINNWKVCLCSDIAGETVVDEFLLPAVSSFNAWMPLTLTKVGDGNLGASIKSIALYTGSDITDMASDEIYVDDFIACTTAGLNLQSLISKNSAEQGGTEGWYGIKNINGTTVNLDNAPASYSSAGRGYSTTGTSPDTVTTYKRETIKTALAAISSTKVGEVKEAGTVGVNIEYQGGYNTADSQQDGETFFDGLNGFGYGIYDVHRYITFNHINFARYYVGLCLYGADYCTVTNSCLANCGGYSLALLNGADANTLDNIIVVNGGTDGIYLAASANIVIGTITVNNNMSVGYFDDDGTNNIVSEISEANNNGTQGVHFSINYECTINKVTSCNWNGAEGLYFFGGRKNKVWWISTTGNTGQGVEVAASAVDCMIANALMGEATEITFTGLADKNYRFYSMYHDQGTNHKIFTDGGMIVTEATDRVGGTGLMWKISPTSTRTVWYPLNLSIAKIAVVADKLVTVKAYMKKSHATNVVAKLVCRGGQLAGIGLVDVVDTKADDTDWEELEVTFTPTQAGVVEIEAWAYYAAANADVYVEDMTITQAD